MLLKRFKIIFGLSSIAGYILITCLFFIFKNSLGLSHLLAQLYNLVIIFGWLAFGFGFGWLAFLICVFSVALQSLFSGFMNLNWQSTVFFAVSIYCWVKFKNTNASLARLDLKLENLQEGKNTAFEKLKQKQLQTEKAPDKFPLPACPGNKLRIGSGRLFWRHQNFERFYL